MSARSICLNFQITAVNVLGSLHGLHKCFQANELDGLGTNLQTVENWEGPLKTGVVGFLKPS